MSRPDRTYVAKRLAEIRGRRALREPGRRVLDSGHIAAVRRRFRVLRARITTRPWAGR